MPGRSPDREPVSLLALPLDVATARLRRAGVAFEVIPCTPPREPVAAIADPGSWRVAQVRTGDRGSLTLVAVRAG